MKQEIRSLEAESLVPAIRFKETFALDVLVGLSEARKSIPTIYHYDNVGSHFFNEITDLPEYYLTRCEKDVLARNSSYIAEIAGDEPFNLVEFGPGDGSKVKIIIDELISKNVDFQYVPIDISKGALDELAADFKENYADVNLCGLIADFTTGLKWLHQQSKRKNLVLFLGSNIGNFDHHTTRVFLRNLWISLNNGDSVIVGFDLKKDIELLLAAYNDKAGVTAEFNLNVLRRINSELGGHFDVSKFRHYNTYNVFSGAMESFLVSLKEQEVAIDELGKSFSFRQWEPIHTEYSYKYLESDIENLAIETGFKLVKNLYDAKRYFIDSIWTVEKNN